jgi:hypothetical protein
MPSQSRLRSSLKGCGAPAQTAVAQLIANAAETHRDLNRMLGKAPIRIFYTPDQDQVPVSRCYLSALSNNWMCECRQQRDPMRRKNDAASRENWMAE